MSLAIYDFIEKDTENGMRVYVQFLAFSQGKRGFCYIILTVLCCWVLCTVTGLED